MATSLRRKAAGRVNALAGHHGPDAPETVAARAELAAVTIEEHIRRVVDEAPPLSEATRARLAALLWPGGAA